MERQVFPKKKNKTLTGVNIFFGTFVGENHFEEVKQSRVCQALWWADESFIGAAVEAATLGRRRCDGLCACKVSARGRKKTLVEVFFFTHHGHGVWKLLAGEMIMYINVHTPRGDFSFFFCWSHFLCVFCYGFSLQCCDEKNKLTKKKKCVSISWIQKTNKQ